MLTKYFTKDDSEYKRSIDPIGQYIKQTAIYLSTNTGMSVEECADYIKKEVLNNKDSQAINPIVHYFERDQETLDRHTQQSTLSDYIYTTVTNGDILVPSMTTYVHPSVKKSLVSEFAEDNTKIRNSSKKKAFEYRAKGNIEMFIVYNNEQGKKKIYNNSVSGGFGSNGTTLFNPSAHSTLTSTTATVTSLGNAINEKFITGNRHYWSADIVVYNILAIIDNIDMIDLEKTINTYNLHIPTVDDVMECVLYSTNLYFVNRVYIANVRSLVEKISPIARAAFVYIGDFYHLTKHNGAFIRQFIDELSYKDTSKVENGLSKIKAINESISSLAALICEGDFAKACTADIKSLGKDYELLDKLGLLDRLISTSYHIEQTLDKYSDFIRTFFVSALLPPSIAHIKHMVRRTVVISDTDSSMFSTDYYVKWYYGKVIFTPEAFAIASSITFLSTQSVANGLKILSANINVAKDKLEALGMKPEFAFPVFAQTSVSKHYFAGIAVQEGNVFRDLEYETKGVHLINSALPKYVRDKISDKLKWILNTVLNNEQISLKEYLTEIADLERYIKESILNGKIEFFKKAEIKTPDAYSGPIMQSPYMHHELWTKVFQPKYGSVGQVPYSVIKIPLAINNKTQMKLWIDNMQDRDIAARLDNFMIENKKATGLGTILLSSDFAISNGIPKEIVPVIDCDRIILDLTLAFRLVAETLGFFPKVDVLISDHGY